MARMLVFHGLKQRARRSAVGAARSLLRTGRRAWWVARRGAYYLLPPFAYTTLRVGFFAVAPRAFHSEARAGLKAALRRRLAPPPPPAPAAVEPPPPAPVPPAATPSAVAVAVRAFRDAYALPEDFPEQIAVKLARYRELCGSLRYDRVRIYREIARLERAAGDPAKACVYALRGMRLLGNDRHGDLAWVLPALERAGYGPEAAAAAALYAPRPGRDRDCARLIDAAWETHRTPPPLPAEYAVYDDRRGPAAPRVSVVITVYNAADKLPKFLEALQLQTLNRAGRMELIVVDSCSPTDDYAAFKGTDLAHPIPTLYIRTTNRETIQTAWNRGIALARGEYISLLGVDEGISPDTLEVLAAELDADPAADWAQGDVLVTEVDRHGSLTKDVMEYDRTTDFFQDLVYLETCYLGPVGAVHRRAMHDRVGYFDGSYRGAGDTEFKNRVLPHIRVKGVPRMLGLYLNFPEERTTQSPRAELEDFRAWYLHRTPAGLRRAFAGRPAADLERLAVAALRYRKSYCGHWSTDFELADAALRVLREKAPTSPVLALAPGVGTVLEAYRELDNLPAVRPETWAATLAAALRRVAAVREEHAAAGLVDNPFYDVFNDNRYEQHQTLW